ncbi:AAA family ATPase, partial [Staphylococcus sp. E463]
FNILQSLNLYYDYLVSDNDKNEIIKTAKEFYDNEGRVTGAINKIFYGAPGTGKSYKVDSLFNNFERVTFHPEYTYFDFVGGLRPVQNEDKSVSYSFVPGIFTDILIKAVENKTKNIGIIIEEINRANTAAVFGDLFQLLDRDDDGQSKYIIKNKDICDYIENKTGKKCESIYIPSNMSIVATMNSADQGVFVMDSAFKRRWQFEYMPISFDAEDLKDVKIAGFDMYWKDFGAILNEHLSSEEVDVDEDKLIGQRFINKHDMQDKDLIASKLLIYLWDDVVRYNRQSLFKESKVFSNLIEHFKESGIDCFVDPLKKKLEVAKNEGNNYYD